MGAIAKLIPALALEIKELDQLTTYEIFINQDLRKFTLKTPYVGANGIRPHPRVVPVRKSC